MKAQRVLKLLAWAVVPPVLLVLGLRAFVGDVFLVDSVSMEPVLHGDPRGGDRVFVRYDEHPPLARFDLVVLRRPGERAPVVKRVAGLPGETVQLSGGDLYVGTRLLASEARRAPWVTVFDSTLHSFAELFHFDRNRWTMGDAGWRVDGRGARALFAKFRPRLMDDYLAPDGARVEGLRYVNDAALEVEARLPGAFGSFVLRVTEESDLFSAELSPAGTGRLRARLLRSARSLSGESAPEVLGVAELEHEPGQWLRLRFSNRDNELCFDAGEREGLLRHRYALNTPAQRTPDGGYTHALPRVELGGDELALELRSIRVERDTTWFESGRFGVSEPEVLAPDELFVLGDNSAESRDSREWGPVPLSSVIGTPRAVVWPRARWRSLAR